MPSAKRAASRRAVLRTRTVAHLWTAGLANVLTRHVIDNHHVVLITRAVAHHDHGTVSTVHELVERAAGNQRRHAGLQNGGAAVGKAHGAFALEAGENLILVVTMQLIVVARIGIIVHPRVQLARVHHHRALLLLQRNLFRIDDLDSHDGTPQFKSGMAAWWHSFHGLN